MINNAGVFEERKSMSTDGFEMTWAINVLAPFLLTSLLKDIITTRVVNVSSISAGSRIDFDNLQQVTLHPLFHNCTEMCQEACHTSLAVGLQQLWIA